MYKNKKKNIKKTDEKIRTNKVRLALDIAVLMSRLVQVVEFIKDKFDF